MTNTVNLTKTQTEAVSLKGRMVGIVGDFDIPSYVGGPAAGYTLAIVDLKGEYEPHDCFNIDAEYDIRGKNGLTYVNIPTKFLAEMKDPEQEYVFSANSVKAFNEARQRTVRYRPTVTEQPKALAV